MLFFKRYRFWVENRSFFGRFLSWGRPALSSWRLRTSSSFECCHLWKKLNNLINHHCHLWKKLLVTFEKKSIPYSSMTMTLLKKKFIPYSSKTMTLLKKEHQFIYLSSSTQNNWKQNKNSLIIIVIPENKQKHQFTFHHRHHCKERKSPKLN